MLCLPLAMYNFVCHAKIQKKPATLSRWDSNGEKDEYDHRQLQVIQEFCSSFYTCILQHSTTTHIENNTTVFNVFCLNLLTNVLSRIMGESKAYFSSKCCFTYLFPFPFSLVFCIHPSFCRRRQYYSCFPDCKFYTCVTYFIHCLYAVAEFAKI